MILPRVHVFLSRNQVGVSREYQSRVHVRLFDPLFVFSREKRHRYLEVGVQSDDDNHDDLLAKSEKI